MNIENLPDELNLYKIVHLMHGRPRSSKTLTEDEEEQTTFIGMAVIDGHLRAPEMEHAIKMVDIY